MTVEDTRLCPRFVGRYVDGVTIGPSPLDVQLRLIAAGMRPVSNVVDASNYVMLELGKPIHTFDAAAVTDGAHRRPPARGRRAARDARPRRARPRPRTRCSSPTRAGPLGIAGVMGGAVERGLRGDHARSIVESAIFDPV